MTLTPAPDGYPIKLVRDNTQQIINASGEPGELFYASLPIGGGEYLRRLRQKLGEETSEFLVDGGWDELSDVLAVVEALAVELGADLDMLIKTMREDPRGGFLGGVIMYGRHPEYDR